MAGLANNGGPTRTHAITGTSSPAHNAGDLAFNPNSYSPPLLHDQRGAPNMRKRGARVDVGAYELQFYVPTGANADFDSNTYVDGGDLLRWQRNATKLTGGTHAQGDADGDGAVDSLDLYIWQQQFGTRIGIAADFSANSSVGPEDFVIWADNVDEDWSLGNATLGDGDANGDGVVDMEDYLAWQAQYSLATGKNDWIHSVALLDQMQEGKILVSTLVDENDGDYSLGDLSLREAIVIARQTGGEIIFAKGLSGSILLASELSLTTGGAYSTFTITGPGQDAGGNFRITLDAQQSSRVLSVGAGATATIAGLALTGGGAVTQGGGLYVAGTATLDGVLLQGNDISGVSNSQGGGVYVAAGGTLALVDSTVDGNEAVAGGGLFVNSSAGNRLTVTRSAISNNAASGGGGGVTFFEAAGGSAAEAVFVNATISGNSAGFSGGVRARYSGALLTFVHSTIADNDGGTGAGGVELVDAAQAAIKNSIVATNFNGSGASDVGGTLASTTAKSIFGTSVSGASTTNNQVGVDPKIEPLANYAGPTKTHKLTWDSPAIDYGGFATAASYAAGVDQRGLFRFMAAPSAGSLPDAGAYEYGIVVTRADDETPDGYARNDLTLREALSWAAAVTGADVIEFSPDFHQGASGYDTITLASHLAVTSDVSILGPGADKLTLAASGANRVFGIDNGAYGSGGLIDVSISGLTIDGGNLGTTLFGGALYNYENLTLDSVVVTGSTAKDGGALKHFLGELTIVDSAFQGNTGQFGGAVQIDTTEQVTIRNSTFEGNSATAAGGISGSGSGGAIYLKANSSAKPALFANSTFSGNHADLDGGAIVTAGAYAKLVHATIAHNEADGGSGVAGGVKMSGASQIELHNTILALNTINNGAGFMDIAGTTNGVVAASSHTIFGAGANGQTLTGAGNQIGSTSSIVDPLLDDLDFYGGKTKTHRLLPYSPAFDAGDNAWAIEEGLVYDQRGESRYKDGYADGVVAADIGAYEADADEFFARIGT